MFHSESAGDLAGGCGLAYMVMSFVARSMVFSSRRTITTKPGGYLARRAARTSRAAVFASWWLMVRSFLRPWVGVKRCAGTQMRAGIGPARGVMWSDCGDVAIVDADGLVALLNKGAAGERLEPVKVFCCVSRLSCGGGNQNRPPF